MATDSVSWSTDEWERELGQRIRRLRILKHLEQRELAQAANISETALKNLEGGKGTSLKTFIKTLRALGRLDAFDALEPRVSVSPLQLAQSAAKRMPSRVRKRKQPPG